MKELSIEEKARRYNEAIKKAEVLYKTAEPMSGCNVIIETLFPELKENEDEKTKRILHSISSKMSFHLRDIFTEEEFQCFDAWSNAWLEKQANHANFRNKIEVGDKVTRNRDGYLVNLSQLNRVAKVEEKQGEQKLTDEEMKTLLRTEYEKGRADAIAEMQKIAWSEEDETTKNNISHIIRHYDKISKRENQPCYYVGDCLLWMQNIKDRVQPQPKQEWSEEDEK